MKYDKYKIEVYVRPNEISGSDLTNTGHFLSTALLSQHYFQKKEFYFCIIILQLYLMTITEPTQQALLLIKTSISTTFNEIMYSFSREGRIENENRKRSYL